MVIGDVRNGTIDFSDVRYVPRDYYAEIGESRTPRKGNLLYTVTGSFGIPVLVESEREFCVQRHIAILKPVLQVSPRYLVFALATSEAYYQAVEAATGTAQKTVGLQRLRQFQVPLATAPEQKRIVEAIESHFTRLDNAVATLERVERNLKRYCASVLKSAVEGRLVPTEAALAKQERRTYEPASVLLERILAERRRRWSQSGKKGKYEEPAPPDTGDLPDLPEGWCWATVDQLIAEDLANGRSVPTATSGFPVLRLTTLKEGGIDLAERKVGAWTREEAEPYLVKQGDFLVARGNGSIRLVGRGGLLRQTPDEVAYPDTLIRVRLSSGILLELFNQLWHSQWVRNQIERKAKTTAGIYKVNQTDLSECVMPLMPSNEQHRILEAIERLTSVVTVNEQAVIFALSRANRLRQAILKWAFEGKLADQDPADEPASVLLERIKAERQPRMPLKDTVSRRVVKKQQDRA